MKILTGIFDNKNTSRGSMLVELLLSIALASIIIPFVFRYQQDAVTRAQNVAITNEMTEIQVALERYIMAHRTDLLGTVGRNITRVKLDDLAEFGVPETVLNNGRDRYQLRVLKSSDTGAGATLQGVVVRESSDITPMRTREIVNLSGGSMGFVDGTHAYGTFGAWHTDTVDIGVDMENALVETTNINRDGALYLWRVPSDSVDDATMMSPLNLGGHDIIGAKFLNANNIDFAEGLNSLKIVSQPGRTAQHLLPHQTGSALARADCLCSRLRFLRLLRCSCGAHRRDRPGEALQRYRFPGRQPDGACLRQAGAADAQCCL